jgi:hypothetical protein
VRAGGPRFTTTATLATVQSGPGGGSLFKTDAHGNYIPLAVMTVMIQTSKILQRYLAF